MDQEMLSYQTPRERGPRRGLILLIIALTGVFAIPLLSAIIPKAWDPRVRSEIDIHSGRVRETRYFLGARTRQVVRDTPLSEALGGRTIGVGEEWHQTNERGLGVRCTYGEYSPAPFQTEELQALESLGPLTPAAKVSVAENLLRMWQAPGGVRMAGKYLQSLSDFVLKRTDMGSSPVDVADLPPVPTL